MNRILNDLATYIRSFNASLKNGQPWPLFLFFSSFQKLRVKKFFLGKKLIAGFKHESSGFERTALPTVPQPRPFYPRSFRYNN